MKNLKFSLNLVLKWGNIFFNVKYSNNKPWFVHFSLFSVFTLHIPNQF